MQLSLDVLRDLNAHVLACFPEEAVGFVVGGRYVPIKNVAADPTSHIETGCDCRLCAFRTAPAEWLRHGTVEMVIHSHPNGLPAPSQADMIGQIASGVPWAIIATDGERVSELEMFGDECPIVPLIGRDFLHGIRDCYSLIRDTFRAGREALERQEVTRSWPFDPIILPPGCRDDGWWETDQDLYSDNFEPAGFRKIALSEVRPGDVFLSSIRSEKLNHGGLLVDHDLIMHHLPGRASRREPAGIWARQARFWIRYEGEGTR